MYQIEIDKQELNVVSGVSAKTGKPYNFKVQKAWAHIEKTKYPVPIEIMLNDDGASFPAGWYGIDYDKAVGIDRNGKFTISLSRDGAMIPIKKAKAA